MHQKDLVLRKALVDSPDEVDVGIVLLESRKGACKPGHLGDRHPVVKMPESTTNGVDVRTPAEESVVADVVVVEEEDKVLAPEGTVVPVVGAVVAATVVRAKETSKDVEDIVTLSRGNKKQRRQYANAVIAEVKVAMGTPPRNAANILVARRIARTTMEKHGLRVTHIAAVLPMIVEATFVEGAHEIAAREWGERVRKYDQRGCCFGWFRKRKPTEPEF